jgi:hypothetical protein
MSSIARLNVRDRSPYYARETFQRGGKAKRVRDPQLGEVWVYRGHGCHCRPTFQHYPLGVDRASQTQRMRALAAIGRTLGMSYRGLSRFLSGFRVTYFRFSPTKFRTKTVRDPD